MIDTTDGNLPSEVWIINAARVRKGLGPLRLTPTTGLLRGRAPGCSLLDIGVGEAQPIFYGRVNGAGMETLYTLDEAFASLRDANAATQAIVHSEALIEQARFSQAMAKLDCALKAASV